MSISTAKCYGPTRAQRVRAKHPKARSVYVVDDNGNQGWTIMDGKNALSGHHGTRLAAWDVAASRITDRESEA